MAKHDFYLDEDGKIDIWRMDHEHHNGPACRRCGDAWCHHCNPEIYEEECPNQQLDFELTGVDPNER